MHLRGHARLKRNDRLFVVPIARHSSNQNLVIHLGVTAPVFGCGQTCSSIRLTLYGFFGDRVELFQGCLRDLVCPQVDY